MIKDVLREFGYWHIRHRVHKFRQWLAKFYPKWLITDALTHAGVRKTRDNEMITEIRFFTVYERWYKEGRHG